MRVLRWIAAGLVGLAVFVAAVAAVWLHRPADLDGRLDKVARLAEAGVRNGRWPGAMWAVVTPGEVLATGAAGFADLEAARAMTPETLMPIGSISKVIVGMSAAQAILDSAVGPAAPISDVVHFAFDPPDGAPRTLEQLATHSAGIVDTDAGYEAVGYHYGSAAHPIPLEDFLARYQGAEGDLFDPANFAADTPGARYSYSNIGAGLAAQVIADGTGVPFAAYSAKVLAPLNLSGGWGHLPLPARPAALYGRGDDGALEPLPPYGLATWPDGQFNTSALELARLFAALLADGMLEGAEVLDPALVREVTRPRASGLPGMAAEDDWIGLFWGRETLSLWPMTWVVEGHSGGDPGVLTFMYRAEGSETGFVLMLNGEPNGLADTLALVRMVRLLYGAPAE